MEKLRSILEALKGKKVLILGFGREGRSTFNLLQEILPGQTLLVADRNGDLAAKSPELQQRHVEFFGGEAYLDSLRQADVIIRSPGIPFLWLPGDIPYNKYTSQTELFLRAYRDQVTGITGTKGKSTTTALLRHLLETAGIPSVIAGNIGIPPFSVTGRIGQKTRIILELSCHQLHHLRLAPATSILLNLFQEHLDHYRDTEEYHRAKFSIASRQRRKDTLIYHGEDRNIARMLKAMPVPARTLPFTLAEQDDAAAFRQGDSVFLQVKRRRYRLPDVLCETSLPGEHNVLNILAASLAATIHGAAPEDIATGIRTFSPLEHRLEFFGEYRGIRFYNDSISTIPEAAIRAVNSIPGIHTLILGGTDRGIDYSPLIGFLPESGVGQIICMGEAGGRIRKLIESEGIPVPGVHTANSFEEVVRLAFRLTPAGRACLLSPAAASYDWFSNFEERGRVFKALVSHYGRMDG